MEPTDHDISEPSVNAVIIIHMFACLPSAQLLCACSQQHTITNQIGKPWSIGQNAMKRVEFL